MEKIPMTPNGQEKLKKELTHLTDVERPWIIQQIEEALEHGDLKENAEYHSAKEKQAFNEGRITELSSILSRVQIIDPKTLSGNKIMFGATVELVDVDTDEEKTYVLVGTEEADLEKGLISVTSPLGKALIGKSEGDEVTFKAPGGTHEYEVLKVEFKEIKL